MKYFCLLIMFSTFGRLVLFAQDNQDARALVKEGVQLNEQKKYDEAIAKYNQALKIDSGNLYARYELAYSLFSSGKDKEAIPKLAAVISGNTALNAGAYNLLGSIYDKEAQTTNAIEAFKEGIKANPKFQRLYFNLGIAYSHNKQYPEAEQCAIEAIKLEPAHASSLRMYGLVAFHQDKRVNALMGLCSFIMLEPNTPRSAEAFGNIQHILQGGVLKSAAGQTPAFNGADGDYLSNRIITQAVSETGKGKYTSPDDLLAAQLKEIFTAVGRLSEKQPEQDFFRKYFINYFYRLAQSGNMPAFARLLGSAAHKDDYSRWAAGHSKEIAGLDNWIRTTGRPF